MYVSVQFIILEILLGLIFLAILYLMLRELLKKRIRQELQPIKEPLEILAKYLVEQSGAPEEVTVLEQGQGQVVTAVATEASPEKILVEPVDVADEFVALKNANRINAYNLQVQKIWELYKHKKINIKQYNEELVRLKKEYGIDGGDSDAAGPAGRSAARRNPPATSAGKRKDAASKEVSEDEKRTTTQPEEQKKARDGETGRAAAADHLPDAK